MLPTGLADRVRVSADSLALAPGRTGAHASRAPHHARVLVFAKASRPRGCLDRVADMSGYLQAVAAPGPVALGTAVGAHEQADPAAPQSLGDVVEDKMLSGVPRVRRVCGCRVLAVAGGDRHEPRLGDEPIPAERLDCAAADLHVLLCRDRLDGR